MEGVQKVLEHGYFLNNLLKKTNGDYRFVFGIFILKKIWRKK